MGGGWREVGPAEPIPEDSFSNGPKETGHTARHRQSPGRASAEDPAHPRTPTSFPCCSGVAGEAVLMCPKTAR